MRDRITGRKGDPSNPGEEPLSKIAMGWAVGNSTSAQAALDVKSMGLGASLGASRSAIRSIADGSKGNLRTNAENLAASQPGTSRSRSEALNAIKRDLNIPRFQHPEAVNRVPMTDQNGKSILGVDGLPITTREYIYRLQDGSRVVVQEHSASHRFGQDGIGDQGPHFNVRPTTNTRTGSIPGAKDHYSW